MIRLAEDLCEEEPDRAVVGVHYVAADSDTVASRVSIRERLR